MAPRDSDCSQFAAEPDAGGIAKISAGFAPFAVRIPLSKAFESGLDVYARWYRHDRRLSA
jgi:hypothetical protein